MVKNKHHLTLFLPRPGLKPAPLSDSPLLRRSLWACGSVCRSPARSCWCFPPPSRASVTAATARKADPYLQLKEGTRQPGLTAQLNEALALPRKLTVVFLHVRPQVSFFDTVGKGAVSHILALLPSCYVHANLRKGNWVSSCSASFQRRECGRKYLKLRRDGFFGWERSDCCTLSPFVGTYQHHPRVFGPPETKRGSVREPLI